VKKPPSTRGFNDGKLIRDGLILWCDVGCGLGGEYHDFGQRLSSERTAPIANN